ncbi:hypothetical protein TrCOL_g5972 [Triparma columacea]|uniref:Uncharacterized protein n=1 Tax=Triparma columacea TaxID=722753 RepID=A0A9W7GI24_9STRA|nr:hypothetical protein TrCOL_g5972 [Triparma columacea]
MASNVSSISRGRKGEGGWLNKNTFVSNKRRKIDEDKEEEKEKEKEKEKKDKVKHNPLPLGWTRPPSGIPAICYFPTPTHPWFTSRCLPPSSTSFLCTEMTTDPCVDCGDGSYKEYEYVMYKSWRGGRSEVGGRVKRTGGTEGSIQWDGEGVKVNFIPSGVSAERVDKLKPLEGLEGYDDWDDVGRKYFKRIWDREVGDDGYFTYGWWVIEED